MVSEFADRSLNRFRLGWPDIHAGIIYIAALQHNIRRVKKDLPTQVQHLPFDRVRATRRIQHPSSE